MNRLLRNISRWIVGIVFMFSGFVKGVDPLGTAYRIEDYFIAYGTEWASFLSVGLSVLLSTSEFVLGLALISGFRMILISKVLLWMMVFFTGLTFYDALYEPVPDCGCFGDAIKLTNWETFYKNIVLIVLVLIIFVSRRKFKINMPTPIQTLLIFLYLAGFAYFSLYNYNHLPIMDFRAWKEGKQMNPEGVQETLVYLTYRNKNTGEDKEYLSPEYPWNDSIWLNNWEFVDQRTEIVGELAGHGLFAEDENGNDMTAIVLESPNIFVIVAYDLYKIPANVFDKIATLDAIASAEGNGIIWLTSTLPDEVNALSEQHPELYEVYYADDIVLKTMVRSNPGLILMNQGVVKKKWHHNDFPEGEELKQIIKQFSE
ncbi:MAG: DoxX family protein [Bacteroidales bacterium]|jgi:uncharacterized membrane protein YphA (DoxX/SURF4 family)|nr:DoxX family protein [Bacteroidales bacterium]HOI31442.1 DoxX family protein [Bacteroidales bacterium]